MPENDLRKLIKLKDPYASLIGQPSELNRQMGNLEKLSPKQLLKLVTKLYMKAPTEKDREELSLQASRNEGAFYNTLREVCADLPLVICGLKRIWSEPKVSEIYALLRDPELAHLANKYDFLVINLINHVYVKLTLDCQTLSTEEKNCIKKQDLIFSKTKLILALDLDTQLTRMLEGHVYSTITNEGVVELIKKFPELVNERLKGQEPSLVKKILARYSRYHLVKIYSTLVDLSIDYATKYNIDADRLNDEYSLSCLAEQIYVLSPEAPKYSPTFYQQNKTPKTVHFDPVLTYGL